MAYLKFGSSWKIQSPCTGCTIRELGCHSKCDKYAEYQQKLFSFKRTVCNAKKKEELVSGYVAKEKIKNAHGKKWER